jgi:hypothetical protein
VAGLRPAVRRMRLRNVVSRLRASVGPIVERRGELVSLSADVDVDVDRSRSSRAPPTRRRRRVTRDRDAGGRARAGAALGPLLPDSPYADWGARPRERARRVHVGLLDCSRRSRAAARRRHRDRPVEKAIEVEPYEEDRYLRAAEICSTSATGCGRRAARARAGRGRQARGAGRPAAGRARCATAQRTAAAAAAARSRPPAQRALCAGARLVPVRGPCRSGVPDRRGSRASNHFAGQGRLYRPRRPRCRTAWSGADGCRPEEPCRSPARAAPARPDHPARPADGLAR